LWSIHVWLEVDPSEIRTGEADPTAEGSLESRGFWGKHTDYLC